MIILILLIRQFQSTLTENTTDDFNLNRQQPVLRRVFIKMLNYVDQKIHKTVRKPESENLAKPAGLYGELSIIEKLLANYDRRVRIELFP